MEEGASWDGWMRMGAGGTGQSGRGRKEEEAIDGLVQPDWMVALQDRGREEHGVDCSWRREGEGGRGGRREDESLQVQFGKWGLWDCGVDGMDGKARGALFGTALALALTWRMMGHG